MQKPKRRRRGGFWVRPSQESLDHRGAERDNPVLGTLKRYDSLNYNLINL